MAIKYRLGTAQAIAQVVTGSIDSVAGSPNTYTVTIGGHTVSVDEEANVNMTADALVTALNLSTDPYFAAITWDNPSGGTITGTADEAGVPFIATLTHAGAAGAAVTDFTDTIPSSGPNHWLGVDNWSDGVDPVNGDTVYIQDNGINIFWDLDQSAVTLAALIIPKTFTGKIGHDYRQFTTDGAGSLEPSAVEYRDIKLQIGATLLDIGEDSTTGSPTGSPRILIDLGTAVSTVTIHDTAQTPSETGRSAVRLLGVNSSNELFVRSAPGGVSIALDEPNEVSTFNFISISDETAASKVETGTGLSLTSWVQSGGINVLRHISGTAVTTITENGGTLTLEGPMTVTTSDIKAGTFNPNNTNGVGDALVTLNIENGAEVDARGNNENRDWTTVNIARGGSLSVDTDNVTIATLNLPTGPSLFEVS